MGITNACSQSLGSFPVLCDCWKIWVIIGDISALHLLLLFLLLQKTIKLFYNHLNTSV